MGWRNWLKSRWVREKLTTQEKAKTSQPTLLLILLSHSNFAHITVIPNQDLFCCQHTMWLAGCCKEVVKIFWAGNSLAFYALKVVGNVFCGQATQVPNLCSIYSMFSHLGNWAICHSKKVGNLFLPKIMDPPLQQKLIDWWKNTALERNIVMQKFEGPQFAVLQFSALLSRKGGIRIIGDSYKS